MTPGHESALVLLTGAGLALLAVALLVLAHNAGALDVYPRTLL